MKKLFVTLFALSALTSVGFASESETRKWAKPVPFSFEGPFGKFDKAQLQRGYKVYKEVCASCHSMNLISYRNLAEAGGPGFTVEQVKTLAAEIKVADIDSKGEPTERSGRPSDRFPAPFLNNEAAAAAHGAVPPDLSLITKAREGWKGTFNQLWNGIGGPQYVYSVLTGYEEVPHGVEKNGDKHYNPYFEAGPWISMAKPLADGQVTFDDGAPNTADDMAKDVSAFLTWTAEPKMEARKALGFQVLIFLSVLAGLLFFVKRKIWKDAH